jgi:hypothetical protein
LPAPFPLKNTGFNGPLNHSHIANFATVTGGPTWLTPPSIPPAGWNDVDGYSEEFGVDQTSARRVFVGPWVTRYDFLAWALGYTYSVPNSSNAQQGQLIRFLPAQHPEFPWLFATNVKLRDGYGAWTQNPYVGAQDECGNITTNPATGYATNPLPMIGYFDPATGSDALSCIYEVTYQALDYEVRDASYLPNGEMSRWVTKTVTFSNKAQQVPFGWLKWADGTAGAPTEPGLLIFGTMELTYRWRQVPDIPWLAIQNTVGTVNQANFDGDNGYPTFFPGTLLCQSPEVERHRGPTGRVMWDILYKFAFLPVGWNSFPRRDTSGSFLGYFPVVFGSGSQAGQPLYKPADFTQLFVPPAPSNYQTPTASSPGCP